MPTIPPKPDPSAYAVAGYRLSLDPSDLDLDTVHGFLTQSYWSPGVSRETVAAAHRHSLTIACLTDPSGAPGDGSATPPRQVGGARIVTDRVTIAYLADVFVLPDHRGRGLARWIVAQALAHPALGESLRRFLLFTRDAHTLYGPFGFAKPDPPPASLMIRPGPGYRMVDPGADLAEEGGGAEPSLRNAAVTEP